MNEDHTPTIIRDIAIPFHSLVLFFVKCALAMIPAVIIFWAMMWMIVALVIGSTTVLMVSPRQFFTVAGIAAFCGLMAWLLDFTTRRLPTGRRTRQPVDP